MPESLKRDPEEIVAEWHQAIVFEEFVFNGNRYEESRGKPKQLGDSLIAIGDLLMHFEVKGRESSKPIDDHAEQKWFKREVMEKAIDQFAKVQKALEGSSGIQVKNSRGGPATIKISDARKVIRLAIYRPHLDYGMRGPFARRFYDSSRVGFVHLVSLFDYLILLRVLITPKELLIYFRYRESLIKSLTKGVPGLSEVAMLGHYIASQMPDPKSEYSQEELESVVQNIDHSPEKFGIVQLLNKMGSEIHNSDDSEINKDGFRDILRVIATLRRFDVDALTSMINDAMNLAFSPSFNDRPDTGWYLHERQLFPANGLSVSCVIVNEKDSLMSRTFLHSAASLVMQGQQLEVPSLTHHISFGFIKEPEDVRMLWSIRTYPVEYDREALELYQSKLTGFQARMVEKPFPIKTSLLSVKP